MNDHRQDELEIDERTQAEIRALVGLALGFFLLREWRKSNLRWVVVGAAVGLPLAGVGGLWILRDLVKDVRTWDVLMHGHFSSMATYFGGGLLFLGAILQILATSAEFKRRDGVPILDGFVLGGWTTIALGALLAWGPSLVDGAS